MTATPQQPTSRFFDQLTMLLFMAWRNIWRNPIRSLLTISALAGSLVMIILYSALLEGMSRQMIGYATEISSAQLQVHRQAYIDDQDIYATLPWSYLQRLQKLDPDFHFAPRLYAAGLASSKKSSTGVIIKAVDPKLENQVTRLLTHIRPGGAGLPDSPPSGQNNAPVLVGTQLAKNLHLKVGSELILVTQAADGSIGNNLYRVNGILKPLEPDFDRMGVLMSVHAYQNLMFLNNGFHELAIKLDDIDRLPEAQPLLQKQIQQLTHGIPLDKLGGQPVVRNWKQLNPSLSDMLELNHSFLLIIGLIVIGLATLGTINTLLMAIHERTHEFGILIAIGIKRRSLLLMVLLESFFLALISAVVGGVIGTLIAVYFEHHGIDFSDTLPDGYDWAGMVFEPVMKGYISVPQVAEALVLMMVLTLIASLIPAWRILRLKIAEVIR